MEWVACGLGILLALFEIIVAPVLVGETVLGSVCPFGVEDIDTARQLPRFKPLYILDNINNNDDGNNFSNNSNLLNFIN